MSHDDALPAEESHDDSNQTLSETLQGERRVALVPDVAAKLIVSGFEVVMERGAGERAGFTDAAYGKADVEIEADRDALLGSADVVLSAQPPRLEDVVQLRVGATTISFLQPATQGTIIEALATHVSQRLLPRISRAQRHGCAVLAGISGRLQGGPDGSESAGQVLSHADDRCWDHPASSRVREILAIHSSGPSREWDCYQHSR